MSVKNVKGLAFAILNAKGYYDFYDKDGHKLEIPLSTIRITQTVDGHDKAVIIFPINVVHDEEEMNKIINK